MGVRILLCSAAIAFASLQKASIGSEGSVLSSNREESAVAAANQAVDNDSLMGSSVDPLKATVVTHSHRDESQLQCKDSTCAASVDTHVHEHHDHAHEHHDHAHEHHHHAHEHHHHAHDHHDHAHDHHDHAHEHHDHAHDHHDHAHDHHDHAHEHHDHAHEQSAPAARDLHALLEDHEKHPTTAVLLTTFSGMAAVVGGLLVVCVGAPSERAMGHMLSFAAGIMLYISFADLLPHAIMDMASPDALAVGGNGHSHDHHGHGHDDHGHSHGHGHGDLNGFRDANVWLFVGMLVFLGVTALLPEVSLGSEDENHDGTEGADAEGKVALTSGADGAKESHAARATSAAAVASAPVAPAVPAMSEADAAIAARIATISSLSTAIAMKEACAALGLPVSGAKSDLKRRLDEFADQWTAAHPPAATALATAAAPTSGAAAAPSDTATRAPRRSSGSGSGHGHSHGVPVAQSSSSGSSSNEASRRRQRNLLMTGLISAVGISLHNLPEGLIVYNQTITGICKAVDPAAAAAAAAALDTSTAWGWLVDKSGMAGVDPATCLTRGVAVTFAIALHNIPEGMAVAAPIYVSTGSRWAAMKYCLLSSICEPLAAILFGWFASGYLTHYVVAALNAAVSGIMICLCLVELIPTAAAHVGAKSAAFSHIAGQAVMFASLYAMRRQGVH